MTSKGFHAYFSISFHFKLSNNKAKYEVVLGGFQLVVSMRAERVKVNYDSKLVVSQVTAEFEANDDQMRRYRDTILQILGAFIQYKGPKY